MACGDDVSGPRAHRYIHWKPFSVLLFWFTEGRSPRFANIRSLQRETLLRAQFCERSHAQGNFCSAVAGLATRAAATHSRVLSRLSGRACIPRRNLVVGVLTTIWWSSLTLRGPRGMMGKSPTGGTSSTPLQHSAAAQLDDKRLFGVIESDHRDTWV